MKLAKELGYNIKMVLDEKTKFIYFKERYNAEELFGEYMEYFYQFKGKSPLAKPFLNRLRGSLCERTREYNSLKTDYNIEDLKTCKMYLRPNQEDMVCKIMKEFVHPHARMEVFLTAFGRCEMSKIIQPIKETIVRTHTDRFYSTKMDIPTSSLFGKLKLEKSGCFRIKSLNNILPINMNEEKDLKTSCDVEYKEMNNKETTQKTIRVYKNP